MTMYATKLLGKPHVNRLVEMEEQMLDLREVLDSIRFRQARLDEIKSKVDRIDTMNDHLDGFPLQELMMKVGRLEDQVIKISNF